MPVVAGAAEANVRETVAACEAYAQMGAHAVAIVSPFYYKLPPESVYAYFAEIARQTPIDVTLYNIPMFASPIDVPTIRRLAEEFPRVIGIKDSSGDLAFMMRMIAAVRPIRPDFSFLTGWEAALVPMLLIGCDGGAHAAANAVPEVIRRMYDLTRAGDLTTAMDLQRRFVDLFDAMLDHFEFPDGFRAAAELRGFNLGRGRQPQTEAQRAQRATLIPNLQRALSRFDLAPEGKVIRRALSGVSRFHNIGSVTFPSLPMREALLRALRRDRRWGADIRPTRLREPTVSHMRHQDRTCRPEGSD